MNKSQSLVEDMHYREREKPRYVISLRRDSRIAHHVVNVGHEFRAEVGGGLLRDLSWHVIYRADQNSRPREAVQHNAIYANNTIIRA